MKPVIIIAIAFVLLIPTTIFAEIDDVFSLFPNSENLTEQWEINELVGDSGDDTGIFYVREYEEKDIFPHRVLIGIGEHKSDAFARGMYDILFNEKASQYEEIDLGIYSDFCSGTWHSKNNVKFFTDIVCFRDNYLIMISTETQTYESDELAYKFLRLTLDKFPPSRQEIEKQQIEVKIDDKPQTTKLSEPIQVNVVSSEELTSPFPPSNYLNSQFYVELEDPYDVGGLKNNDFKSYVKKLSGVNSDQTIILSATHFESIITGYSLPKTFDEIFEHVRTAKVNDLTVDGRIIEKNPLSGETCAKITGHFTYQSREIQTYVCQKLDYIVTARMYDVRNDLDRQVLIDFLIYSLNNLEKMINEQPISDSSIKESTVSDSSIKESTVSDSSSQSGGGCLIATATYGSELAPQVQQLREIRYNSLLTTTSGTQFMDSFNGFYYSFSPVIADYERENPVFREMVKVAITPMVTSLSLMEYADSEESVLGIGISLIILNVGMYVSIPVVAIMRLKKNRI